MLASIKLLFSNIGTIIALLQLIPTLTELIHQVEEPGIPGAQKKNAVLTLLQNTLNFATQSLKMNLPVTTIMAWANTIVDTIVNILNDFGKLIPHGSTAPVTATAAPLMAAPAPTPVTVTNVAPIPVVEANNFDPMSGKPGVQF
jgi:ABC-type sulfate transport system permease component